MTNYPTLIHQRVHEANAGTNPTAICQLQSGWAVLGDRQFLPGYCLLLPDPVVGSLNDLSESDRAQFLLDMTAIGDAILKVTDALRMNYSILGNTEAALHAHIFARYKDEPAEYRGKPVWSYPREQRKSVPFDLSRDKSLMDDIRNELGSAGVFV